MGDSTILECRALQCGYGAPIVHGVDLTVPRGEILAILGPSGSGKSTLLRTLIGLLPPLSGQVELLGSPIYPREADAASAVMRRIGVLFQSDALFGSLSVLDNVLVPLRQHHDVPEEIAVPLARAKLAQLGLEGLGGRAPSALSGGQRKRVALARATILDPDLLFCDEPSSGLDPIASAALDEILLELRDTLGVTIVVVTHDLESARAVADRILILADGAVAALGTPDEVRASDDEQVRRLFERTAPPREGDAGVLERLHTPETR